MNKLNSCKYLFTKESTCEKVEGKENLQFGTEASYKFKDNDYLNSVSAKFVLTEQGLKLNKSFNLKGCGQVFDEANLSWKANVKLKKKFI